MNTCLNCMNLGMSQQLSSCTKFSCTLITTILVPAINVPHEVGFFIEGFFTGFVYLPCLTIFQKMFPANKGLITGIINLTFGGAAAVMSPIFTYLLLSKGYIFTSNFCALMSLCTGALVALLIKIPDNGDNQAQKPLSTMSFKNIISLPPFWRLWGVWALAGAAGISLIVLASSFGEYLGYGITQYVYILTCFNVLNGIGRVVSGRLADIYSKQKILMTIFFMASIAYVVMPWLENLYLVCFMACFIGLGFGAMFTVSAPLVTEVFGLENFGKIFGMVFTAYGFVAGLLGPWLSGVILDMTNLNFKVVFSLFALFYLVSAFLISGVRTRTKIS